MSHEIVMKENKVKSQKKRNAAKHFFIAKEKQKYKKINFVFHSKIRKSFFIFLRGKKKESKSTIYKIKSTRFSTLRNVFKFFSLN